MRHPRKTAFFTPWSLPAILKTVGQVRLHVLYKRPDFLAHSAIPAIAVSVTYRKHETAANPGSIPVSATQLFYNHNLAKIAYRVSPAGGPQKTRSRHNSNQS